MKKLFFIALIIFSAYYAQAQTTSLKKEEKKEKKADKKDMRKLKKDIRAVSKASFAKDFVNVTQVTWITDSVFDVASFSSKGNTMEAYYDETGTLVGTLTFISFTSLPEKSKTHIKKEYKNFSSKKTIRYNDNKNNNTAILLYGTKLNADNYFVEISDDIKDIMLLVTLSGDVTYLSTL